MLEAMHTSAVRFSGQYQSRAFELDLKITVCAGISPHTRSSALAL
jgi:hypothetical protein